MPLPCLSVASVFWTLMRYQFQAEQWLPYTVERTFGFFADPANLPRLMPAWQKAKIESASYVAPPPAPVAFAGAEKITAGTGTRLTLTILPVPFSPVRLPWVAVIEDFRWLAGFCDVQEKGPFQYWRHCHSVTPETRDGVSGTRLRDAVEYEMPLGVLGRVANALFVRRQLAATFAFRQRKTLELMAQV
jgi:ligand-binding SRPBCC domain-containing protein